AVTYTSVYTDSKPGMVFWGADEKLSDGGSPRVIVYGYDGLHMLLVAPPSPDYVPSPEEPQTPLAPQDEDEHEPMFIQPHDPDFSPEYVAESDPEEDPKEHDDDETEDGLVDYPMDRGDDGNDDDGDSSGDDANDEDEGEEEEEEHLAPTDSAVVIPTDELVSPHEETESVIPPSSTNTGARITERLARYTALDASPLPLPLHMPPPVDSRDDIPESEMSPRKRLCLSTLGSRYEVRESSTARPTGGRGIDYGFVSTLDAEARR
nr:hypothetical protein [Tanacetum cinerariifolium]